MAAEPSLSICISTMDRPSELRRCLESILRGTILPLEIVVSDDSREPTITRKVCEGFALVRYVPGPCRGQGANRQSAATAARGDYFSFIDDDAVMSTTFLRQMQSAAAASTGREIFTGDVLENGKRISPTNLTFLGHFGQPVRGELCTVNFNANAFPRSTLSVAAFDRHLKYGYEDSDFCTQAVAAGYQIMHLPDVCNEHMPSPINRAANYQFCDEARFYTSLKRYTLIEQRPVKAIAYFFIAPLHQSLHLLRHGRGQGAFAVVQDMWNAVRYLRSQRSEKRLGLANCASPALSISVIVPTFQRPEDLARCLRALSQQFRSADEIVVVARPDDAASVGVAERFGADLVLVQNGGQVAALNAGISAATGQIIAITDDDAEPWPDWLARIERAFQNNPCVGGVGGRDICHATAGSKRPVGRLQWFGRLIGNHDAGSGGMRDVDVLKGVNMSFRRCALEKHRFDERLRGDGAQVDNELQLCLALKRDRWQLVYDPRIVVSHRQAFRKTGGDRITSSIDALRAATHNNTLATLEHLSPWARLVFVIWAIAVGTRRDFGIVQFLRFAPGGTRDAWSRLCGSLLGRLDGYHTWRTSAN